MNVAANPVYQTVVTELEAVLSPRIVSRALKEGLRQLGRSPETADLLDIEKVLKSQVYRQLQVLMPVTQAKETVAGILERLAASPASASVKADAGGDELKSQGKRLAALQAELRPFNLYFEWPEVQKLRAQVQLAESDHLAGREAPALLADAEAQLDVVKQKLEDQLVLQARDLAVVQEALEEVRASGGLKVRRLETLVNQVAAAQEQRHLVQAELERAHRLARDLRKELLRSDEAQPAAADVEAEAPTAASAAPDVKLTAELAGPYESEAEPASAVADSTLDIDAEARDLRALEADFGDVLDYLPELKSRLDELRAELEAQRSVAPVLSGLRGDLEATRKGLRDDLREELTELSSQVEAMRPEVSTAELDQALRVTLGILSTSLPSRTDVEHVRRLHQLALEQENVLAEEERQREATLAAQAELLQRLESTLLQRSDDDEVRDEVERLRSEFDQLRVAQQHSAVVPDLVSAARQAEEALARTLAARATEASERMVAQLTALRAQLEGLPVTATLTDRAEALRSEVERLLREQEAASAVAGLLLDVDPPTPPNLDTEFASLNTEVEALRLELTGSLRSRLMRLAEEAAALGNHPLIEHIQRALLGLELERYPDLGQFQAALRQEREAQRQEQVDELKRLSQAASAYEGYEQGAELKTLIAEARARLEAGEPAQTLKRAAELLRELEARAEATLAGLPARLDAALEALEPVSKLNSDGVVTVRRILSHLDSQRTALPRLSRGLQLQLEQALSQSERMLVDLRSEYEATRMVADQVVSGGLLDGVLGLFKTPTERDDESQVAASGTTPPGSDEGAAEAAFSRERVIDDYLSERFVSSAAWFGQDGSVLAGDPATADFGGEALGADQLRADTLLAEATAACWQSSESAVIVAWLPNGERVVIRLSDPDLAGLMVNRVRRDSASWAVGGAPR